MRINPLVRQYFLDFRTSFRKGIGNREPILTGGVKKRMEPLSYLLSLVLLASP
jgi:hypothetical protein